MNKLKMHTPNLTDINLAILADLFPNCITETRSTDGKSKRVIDFDQLRQELSSEIVDGQQERYQLNWPRKREALLIANTPISKTLRPCREESLDFDLTRNLFIEGDNLDALKLLQESYLNKVKVIYIDPPYNTGNDFIYSDDFSTSIETYFQISGQSLKGVRMVANTEANGRFHSDWLTMIYPRLKLARNLLCENGLIFISIDDVEVANMRKVCEEIFGESNYVAQFIWKSRVSEDNRKTTGVSTDHEYVLCFSKGETSLKGVSKDLNKFQNPDNDTRGPWRSADLTGLLTRDLRPNCHYDLTNPETDITYGCPPKGWRYDKNTMEKKISEKRILWPENKSGRPRHKLFVNEMASLNKNITSIITEFNTQQGTREIDSILGPGIFSYPKPHAFIKYLLMQATDENDIILDFFAGSASTAHAVMALNAEDGGMRRYIMIQIPQLTEERSPACVAGYKTIAEIGKERIRRAGKKIVEDNSAIARELDTGFRVFKIDTSNMKDVYYAPDIVKQGDLVDQISNIREDRNAEDLLFQVLLDWGVDLTLPITKNLVSNKNVFFVDKNALVACFDTNINETFVKELAKHQPLRAVFRDASYGSDSVKINVEQIFKLISPTTEVKAI